MGSETPKWKEFGRARSTPTSVEKRVEVKIDDYYVVIGFEVNKAMAFIDGTQDLAVDYGHAFFYLVKNKLITKSFSFGPRGQGKVGWLKDGYSNSRPGTPDYAITEPVKAFKIKLTQLQAKKLELEIDEIRKEIQKDDYKYNAMVNDTCAESAKEVLDDAGIDTPSGYGAIKDSRKLSFPITYSVNPYKWHHNFKKAKHLEVNFTPPGVGGVWESAAWHPPVGLSDPIFGSLP
jgi:hypothetical protein